MAKTRITREVISPAIIHLDLSMEEADLLKDILNCIGGSPDTTRRGLADDIRVSLNKVGVKGLGYDDLAPKSRSVYFREDR